MILWDLAKRTHPARLATISGLAIVDAVAFSSHEQTLATASENGEAYLWDISESAHPKRISTVADDSSGP